MKTWFNLIPLFFIPFVLCFFPALIPRFSFVKWDVGYQVRVYFVDHLILPLLPDASAWQLALWFQHASVGKQVLLHALVSLNVSLPAIAFIYVVGSAYYRLRNAVVIKKFLAEGGAANQ